MERSDWTSKKLGELGECITGLTYSPADVVDEGLLVLRSSNIQGGRLALEDNVYVRNDIANASRAEEGDILVCVRNGSKRLIGKTALVTGDYPESTHGAFMSMYRSRDYKFLFQLFQTDAYKRQVHRNLGATINSINSRDFLRFSFPYPTSEEREKITSVLEAWDAGIHTVESLIRNSQNQKKAMAQQLLTGRRRLLGFAGEWAKKPIGKVCERVQRRDDGEPHPILMISSTRGWVRQDDMYSRYMAGESAKSYVLLKRGEFAYNKGNSKTYPCGCVFPLRSFETGLVPHVYVCFRFKGENEPRFYEHYFAADMLAQQLTRVINTGVRNNGLLNIRPADFLACEVPMPSLEEQAAIADILDSATRQVEFYQAMKKKLEQEKRALMQQLLTGKRRVKRPPEQTTTAKENAS